MKKDNEIKEIMNKKYEIMNKKYDEIKELIINNKNVQNEEYDNKLLLFYVSYLFYFLFNYEIII